jgi:hypothetical protein
MHINRSEVPVQVDVPGATARQQTGFGEVDGYGTMGAEYFSMASGTDLAPLLEGLDGDACMSPHWGYLTAGEVVVTYTSGEEETCGQDELFYWPPGHSVRVTSDAEIILFSPQAEHGAVIDHIREKVGGGRA